MVLLVVADSELDTVDLAAERGYLPHQARHEVPAMTQPIDLAEAYIACAGIAVCAAFVWGVVVGQWLERFTIIGCLIRKKLEDKNDPPD